jgi:hypothetical protein
LVVALREGQYGSAQVIAPAFVRAIEPALDTEGFPARWFLHTSIEELSQARRLDYPRSILGFVLASCGRHAALAIDQLLPLLDRGETSDIALGALGGLGAGSRSYLPALLDARSYSTGTARWAIANVCRGDSASVSMLIAQLSPGSLERRQGVALLGLEGLGPEAAAAIPRVVELRAWRVLGAIARGAKDGFDRAAAEELFRAATSEGDYSRRSAACTGIGLLGLNPERAIPVLVKVLEELELGPIEEQEPPCAAARALASFGTAAVPAGRFQGSCRVGC